MSFDLQVTRREAFGTIAMAMLGSRYSGAALPKGKESSETSAEQGVRKRSLVAYLSRSGNTRVIAGQLKRDYAADVFEIRVADPWPEDYEQMVAWASRLHESGAAPRLAESVSHMEQYDVLFLGFPIWGNALPAPIRTFLTTHDLSGKTLVPFITFGCCGAGTAPETIAELAPKAKILPAFSLKCDQERDTMNSVNAWLRSSGVPDLIKH